MRQEPGQQGPGEQPEGAAKEALSTRGEEAHLSHFLFRYQQVAIYYFGTLAAVCETQTPFEKKGGRDRTPGDTVLVVTPGAEEQHPRETPRRRQEIQGVPSDDNMQCP